MMDGVSRAVADHIKQTERITDHFGDATLGLHRPGFRKLDGGNEGDQILRDGEMRERQRAYDDYEQSTSQWLQRCLGRTESRRFSVRSTAVPAISKWSAAILFASPIPLTMRLQISKITPSTRRMPIPHTRMKFLKRGSEDDARRFEEVKKECNK